MQILETPIQGLLVIKPNIFEDERGCFFESWSQKAFQDIGLDLNFVQDNQSLSQKGVLRGLHFQNPPFAQGKLVRVIKGSVIDVAVDIRKDSITYGQYFSIELSEKTISYFGSLQVLLMVLLLLKMILFSLTNVQKYIIRNRKNLYFGTIHN